jgi:hypothetical protein
LVFLSARKTNDHFITLDFQFGELYFYSSRLHLFIWIRQTQHNPTKMRSQK